MLSGWNFLPEEALVAAEALEASNFVSLDVDQKVAFYDWLLKLNLRNPRQVKRLYNSYNLLWSHYGEARQVVYQYQTIFSKINLLARIEPFVLPASSPQQVENK